MVAQSDDFMTEKAAARVLQLHPGSLRRLRNQGHIAYYRTATGRIHYRFDDLIAFALPKRVEALPAGPR